MLWKLIFASVAFGILYIGYFVWTPPVNAIGQYFVLNYGSLSLNGVTVGQFVSQNFKLFESAFVVAAIFIVVYLIAASQSEEADSGVMG